MEGSSHGLFYSTAREPRNLRIVGDMAVIRTGHLVYKSEVLLLHPTLPYLRPGNLLGSAGSTCLTNCVASHSTALVKCFVFEAYFMCIYYVSLIFCVTRDTLIQLIFFKEFNREFVKNGCCFLPCG